MITSKCRPKAVAPATEVLFGKAGVLTVRIVLLFNRGDEKDEGDSVVDGRELAHEQSTVGETS